MSVKIPPLNPFNNYKHLYSYNTNQIPLTSYWAFRKNRVLYNFLKDILIMEGYQLPKGVLIGPCSKTLF